MKSIFTLLSLTCILAGCKHDCACAIYQYCNNGTCYCGEWGEGTDCTPIRNKFIGTFIGTLNLNNGAPVDDTITLLGDGRPLNYIWGTPYIRDTVTKGFGIHLESSLTGIYFVDYLRRNVANQYLDNFNPIDCGNAQISADGKNLMLTYHTVINPGIIDFSKEYTFAGTKQ